MTFLARGKLNLGFTFLSYLISSTGSILLYIVLSLTVYQSTGSATLTSLFVAAQWVPSVILTIYRSQWEDGTNPIKRCLRVDVISAFLTLPIFFFVDSMQYYAILVLLIIRGLFDYVSKLMKTISCRYIFPEDKVTSYASILQSGYHLGTALATVLGLIFYQHLELKYVVIFDFITYIVAATCLIFVKTININEANVDGGNTALLDRITVVFNFLKGNPRLFTGALFIPLSTAFFQGTYSTLQPIFPIQALGLGENGVLIAAIIGTISVVSGSTLFVFLNKRLKLEYCTYCKLSAIYIYMSILTASVYIVTVSSRDYYVCAVFYALMIFFFELIWMLGYANIVSHSPKGQLGNIFGFIVAFSLLLTVGMSYLSGYLVDIFSYQYQYIIFGYMITYLFISIGSLYVYSWSYKNVKSVALKTEKELS